ncbi:DUF1360 domain-containing protein [Streptomyces sp. PSKA28]|uniref:DUF1360 domain-containing protein n=1 Tax=Streptomyces himalayensis subsp. himalayensis TaxID=2756131 RepID=A0A7W0DPG5_9ACTN|nr:DUF1360 domain-containing protein [Streptomyces himalayensis]MBA2948877.1 DUF1360 domain-containing protein [Streptomyces himalayensis subsp. himalayensis]
MGTAPGGRAGRHVQRLLRRTEQAYSVGHERPLGGYVATLAGFGAYTGAWAAVVRHRGRPLPDRPDPWDVALAAVATFRLSRLLSKAPVTSPLRAPFTTYAGAQGPAELHETPRTEGRETVGELVSCPFCMSVWIVSTLTAGQLLWPRATRTAMGALTALAGADALQLAYSRVADRVTDTAAETAGDKDTTGSDLIGG